MSKQNTLADPPTYLNLLMPRKKLNMNKQVGVHSSVTKHWPSILEVSGSTLPLIYHCGKKAQTVLNFLVTAGCGCDSHGRVFVYNAEGLGPMLTTEEKNNTPRVRVQTILKYNNKFRV